MMATQKVKTTITNTTTKKRRQRVKSNANTKKSGKRK